MSPLLALFLALGAADSASLTEEGVRAYEDMDLDAAREHLSQAQRAAPSRDKPRIELWLGIVELERGNEAAARRWMRSALQANPALVPPPSVSPKVRALVEELRPATRATTPAKVARRARPAVLPPRPAAVSPPASPPGALEVAPHGGPAAEGASPADALPAVALRPPEPAAMPSALVLAGAGAGAVAVGALGGGVLLGVLAQGAAEAAESEARAADATARFDEANATAWAANGLYAFGAVAAAVGVGCAAVEMAGVVE